MRLSGPDGEPIDIGRSSRNIPVGLAKFLITDDVHCHWPGCSSPAWDCEGHHVIWWGQPHDGETNRDNVALLCWHHHHLIHHSTRFRLRLDADSRRLHLYEGNQLLATSEPPGRRRGWPAGTPAPPRIDPADGDDGRIGGDPRRIGDPQRIGGPQVLTLGDAAASPPTEKNRNSTCSTTPPNALLRRPGATRCLRSA